MKPTDATKQRFTELESCLFCFISTFVFVRWMGRRDVFPVIPWCWKLRLVERLSLKFTLMVYLWHHMIWWCLPRPTRTYPLPKRRAFGTDGLTDLLFFFWCLGGATNSVVKSSQSLLEMFALQVVDFQVWECERLQMARFIGAQLTFSRIHASSWRRLVSFFVNLFQVAPPKRIRYPLVN